ncbi:ABC transporter permease [Brevibacillus massiliensis]|uniref:ABC transporter permease n=1 Tax=Brevibacillus massiliensis TaxID=1118054 RepID=UPI000370AED9|nr:ABC transporter permease [Brevibacillus massiliensis]
MKTVDTEQIYRDYVRSQTRQRWFVFGAQIGLFALFLAIWEWTARMGWINVLIFSYPSKVWSLFWEKLLDGSLLPHIFATVLETIVGFLLGTIFGTLVAILIWWSPFLSRVLDPYLVIANSMPKVALGPLFIVGLGPGLLSIIGMACSVSIIITTLVVYTSFKEVDQNYIKVVRTFGASKRQMFSLVILPATMPTIISTLKVNVGLSWIGVIVGEFLVSKQGLGYLIVYGFQVFNFTLVMVSLVVVAVVATLMYQAVAYLERKLTNQFK